jgi:hypothetical protein
MREEAPYSPGTAACGSSMSAVIIVPLSVAKE